MDYKFLSNAETLPKRFIGDIASIKAGGDCPQEWSKYKTKDCQIPIYSNGTDNEGLYGYTKEPTILKRGITVAARGTIGYCTMRNGGYVPIIRLLAVTPNDIGGDVYLHQIFNRIKFRNDGSIQQQLTVPSLASIEIPYPNASTLKAFANITYPLIEKIKQNKIQIEELTKQRDELLPLLMNGQVSVNSDLSRRRCAGHDYPCRRRHPPCTRCRRVAVARIHCRVAREAGTHPAQPLLPLSRGQHPSGRTRPDD